MDGRSATGRERGGGEKFAKREREAASTVGIWVEIGDRSSGGKKLNV